MKKTKKYTIEYNRTIEVLNNDIYNSIDEMLKKLIELKMSVKNKYYSCAINIMYFQELNKELMNIKKSMDQIDNINVNYALNLPLYDDLPF